MSNASWWKQATFYELYVDKFAGNFKRLAQRLDYFSRLGIDCLHILPHYPSPMVDDGYDISDYKGVRPELGTLDDFRVFVTRAHAQGIRIMIDLVINHTSSQHPWFIEARNSKDNPTRDYFLWSQTSKDLQGSFNVFPHLKSSNWIHNPATNDYYFTTFYGEQPDLNWDNPRVIKEILSIMDFWIALGVDAFRIDAASYLVKREGATTKGLPETHAVLKTIRAHIQQHGPHIALLAEVHDTPERAREYFGEDDECHLVYHFPLAERMVLAALHNNAKEAQDLFVSAPSIPEHCQWALFLRNHDELAFTPLEVAAPRSSGLAMESRARLLTGLTPVAVKNTLTQAEQQELIAYCDPERKYVFKNDEGLCMRLASIFKREPEKIRLAFEMLLEFPAASIIYYGEEIGMENDTTIGISLDRRRYVRGAFDWEKAQAQMNDPNSLFSFIAGLLAKRKTISLPVSRLGNQEELVG